MGEHLQVDQRLACTPFYPSPRDEEHRRRDEESDDLEIVIVLPTLTKQVVSVKVEADQARRVAGTPARSTRDHPTR